MADKSSIEKETIRVWDMPTRVFHWTLGVLALLAWITAEAEGTLFWTHLAAGYGVLGLVVFRLAWGVIGTRHARFTDFVRPWPVVRDHTKAMLRFSPSRFVGHTPAGGWMIVALLAVLALLIATGLFAGDEGEKGPLAHFVGAWLADAMSEVHESLNAVLWSLVAFHVAGVLFVSYTTKDNLIRAMWTGRKENPARFIEAGNEETVAEDVPPAGFLRLALSTAVAVAAVLVVAW
ncbi:MAG: cytochrome b/b6 domain-containing protein [Rhodospirillales bacterium]|nr:cytochrome b/b6 domain-containing protein [Rhodospirillales bacterium]